MTPELAQAIAAVSEAARALGLEPVLVGAIAGELAVMARPGMPVPRRSNDADFAVRLPGWDSYQRLKNALIAVGFVQNQRVEHRLSLGSALVDLIPYGPGVSSRQGEITWPGTGNVMSVVGFEEACRESVEGEVQDGVHVNYVEVPGLVLLKIVAFVDRQARGDAKHRSDAEDIYFWLTHYPGDAEEARRFEIAETGLRDVEYLTTGAALLGMDVRPIASLPADAVVNRFLTLAADEYGPFVNAVVSPAFDDERERVIKYASAFRAGYGSVEAP